MEIYSEIFSIFLYFLSPELIDFVFCFDTAILNVFGNYAFSHKSPTMKQQFNADEALAKLKLVESCQQYSFLETMPENSDSENEEQSEKQSKEMMENKHTEDKNGKQSEKQRKEIMENEGTEDKNGMQSEKEILNVFGNCKFSHKQQQLNADEALAKLKLVQSCQ